MKVTDITKEQIEQVIRSEFAAHQQSAREDNALTEIIRQTPLAILDSVFTPTMALATGIRFGLALAQAESFCDENGVPNVVVEDQVAS